MVPESKAKGNTLELTISENKPTIIMIEKDGPIVDSPAAIDLGERHPEEGVGVFCIRVDLPSLVGVVIDIVLTFLFHSLVRAGPLKYDTLREQSTMREPPL